MTAATKTGSGLVLTVLASSQFLMTLDSSVMNVSMAQVAADLGTTITGIQTAITLYTLVMATLMITGGKIGTIMGRRRAFALGLVIYGAGSFTTALAPNLPVLLLGWSLLEGVGAALIMPAIVALVAANFPPERRAAAYGLVAAAGAMAVAAGTHLVLALAATFGGQFRRIQFTPDLMPGDVTGHTLYDMGRQEFRLKQGPVFCNLLLADEINRAPAKTQAALLEVMQENQVTIDGQTLPLSPPFMTLATQNPIEQEGTYPLPEAQLDRFLMKVQIDYPSAQHEEAIVAGSTTAGAGLSAKGIASFATAQDILHLQSIAASVACVPEVIAYAVRLVRATRGSQGMALGAGTRGAIALVKVAKAFALLTGRTYVTPDDIKSAALPVLRHRVALAPELAISGQRIDDFLTGLLRSVEAPR